MKSKKTNRTCCLLKSNLFCNFIYESILILIRCLLEDHLVEFLSVCNNEIPISLNDLAIFSAANFLLWKLTKETQKLHVNVFILFNNLNDITLLLLVFVLKFLFRSKNHKREVKY